MEDKILEILSEIRPEGDFKNSENYLEDGLLDSFDIIELVDGLENAFSCKIDGLDIMPEYFSNLKAICEMVKKSGGTV